MQDAGTSVLYDVRPVTAAILHQCQVSVELTASVIVVIFSIQIKAVSSVVASNCQNSNTHLDLIPHFQLWC